MNGRTKIAINNVISESIPNPTFEVVALPGSFADYFSGRNPEGKTLREMAARPSGPSTPSVPPSRASSCSTRQASTPP